MLRSPTSAVVTCPESTPVQSLLPHSVSLPCTPNLPSELRGSVLRDNQGLPPCLAFGFSTFTHPASHDSRQETHFSEKHAKDKGDLSALLCLFPAPHSLGESGPDWDVQRGTTELNRVSSALDLSATAEHDASEAQQKQCLSNADSQKHSRQSLMKSPSFTDMKSSTSICRESDIDFTQDRVDASRLAQPVPTSVETNAWERNIESREFHHQNVSQSVFAPRSVSFGSTPSGLKRLQCPPSSIPCTLACAFARVVLVGDRIVDCFEMAERAWEAPCFYSFHFGQHQSPPAWQHTIQRMLIMSSLTQLQPLQRPIKGKSKSSKLLSRPKIKPYSPSKRSLVV